MEKDYLHPAAPRLGFGLMRLPKKEEAASMSGFFVSSRREIEGLVGLNRDFPTLKWRKRRRDGVSGNFSDTPYIVYNEKGAA